MFDKPIFKSKRFISAVVGLVLMIAVAYLPQLEGLEGRLASQITDVILALIAGYSLTDIVGGWLEKR